MSNLPPALAPWALHLEIFPRETAIALGPLVRRLAGAIGEWRSLPERGLVEPDGFAGISRRGHYERLLTTEWLLAEEAPLEFLRRAAQGEHAFFQIARRDPQSAGFCAVLCDAGPNQLGAPRLVQMAALLVLARRAAAARARFAWGILQNPGNLHSEITPATLRHFLEARGVAESTAQNIADWREVLPTGKSEECWWLGGPHLKVQARDESLLLLSDPLELETRAVDAVVVAPTATQRTLRLQLPDNSVCAQLLRDPFAAAVVRSSISDGEFDKSTGNLVFSFAGSKLLVRTIDDQVLAYAIPNSPRGEQISRRRYQVHYGFRPVAAGRDSKTLRVIALKDSGEGVVLSFGGKHTKLEAHFDWTEMPEDLKNSYPWPGYLGACYGLPSSGQHLAALLPGGNLIVLEAKDDGYAVVQHEDRVFGMTRTGNDVVYAAKTASGGARRRLGQYNTREVWALAGPAGECMRAVTGYPGRVSPSRQGLWAARDASEWLIHHDTLIAVPNLPLAAEASGVMMWGDDPAVPALLIQNPATGLSLHTADGHHTLPIPAAKITESAISPVAPLIAYRTESGEIGVYSVEQDTHLLRVLPGSEDA